MSFRVWLLWEEEQHEQVDLGSDGRTDEGRRKGWQIGKGKTLCRLCL